MTSLSVLIITYNEESKIGTCLESVKSIANEILIVDSFSTDRTKMICEQFGAKFFERKFDSYILQKNYALELATHDLVLSLDADESLDIEAINHIKDLKQKSSMEKAYRLSRKTFIGKRWIKFGGWYPDAKIRMWNKKYGRWGGDNPHESVIWEENLPVESIKGNILHYSYTEIKEVLDQNLRYAKMAAASRNAQGIPSNKWKGILHGLFKFVKIYFLKLGMLEGFTGLQLAWYYTLSTYHKYCYTD